MQLIIDARLECSSPYLQILDSCSGESLARFDSEELEQLLRNGTITAGELLSSDSATRQQLLQELLLAACCCRIRREGGCQWCPERGHCPENDS